MDLLERADPLARLHDLLARARAGRGACAIVFGEAGAGKTTLIRHFLDGLPPALPRLVAGCEALFLPRPMGPFADLVDGVDGIPHWPPSITAALRDGRLYPGLHAQLLAQLSCGAAPKLLVLEDMHWADEGTLDCVKYLCRRVAGAPLLIVLSFRSDDVDTRHPLRTLLGDLPVLDTQRIEVAPLSRDAVERMAACAGRPAAGLYEATGGNAFFVSEVLSGQPGDVPHSVCDAVLGRLSRLSPAARDLAEWVSVSPTCLERELLEGLVGADERAGVDECIAECLDKRVLQLDANRLAFRHDLARQAVARSLPPGRSAQRHRRLFDALQARTTPAAPLQPLVQRLVHHAEMAGLGAQVLALAPQAARAAARLSAHREAAGLYALALKYADGLDAAAHADLLEAAATEFHLIGASQDFLQAAQHALALRRQAGDAPGAGRNLRLLAAAHWAAFGARPEAQAAISEAVDCLQSLPPSTELALAYAEQARLHCAWSDFEASIAWGARALALAETLADPACLVHVLHASAQARMFVRDDAQALAHLRRALALALEIGMEDAASHLYRTLQMVSLIYRHHAEALAIAEQGIAYCEARDLDAQLVHLVDNQALSQIELGLWTEADRSIARCLALPGVGLRLRNSLQYLRARQDARRGRLSDADAGYWRRLADDPEALPMGYRLPAIAAACAEVAWLQGDVDTARRCALAGAQAALARGDARLLGPLLVWLKRLGATLPATRLQIAPEHAAELAGRIDDAAAHWAAHGCVHERALVLLHGDEAQVRSALDLLLALGAEPAADIARSRLRALGVRGVQRGPHPSTRDDPHGLTLRERKVYELLSQGLSNACIADRLHRSPRTVECHVANVLGKLGARSRMELLGPRAALDVDSLDSAVVMRRQAASAAIAAASSAPR